MCVVGGGSHQMMQLQVCMCWGGGGVIKWWSCRCVGGGVIKWWEVSNDGGQGVGVVIKWWEVSNDGGGGGGGGELSNDRAAGVCV